MDKPNPIFVVPWNDDPVRSRLAVETLYPNGEITVVEKCAFRTSRFTDQVRRLRKLRGGALVFCFRSLDDINAPLLLAWIGLFHRCGQTVLLDEGGNKKVYSGWSWLRLLPLTLAALILDAGALLRSLAMLKFGLKRHQPTLSPSDRIDADIAYLFPYPMSRYTVGGAMSHVRGLLDGLKLAHAKFAVYTGRSLGADNFPEHLIPLQQVPFFFWEARALAYNWRFTAAVKTLLKHSRISALYQRHGRFVVAGALLARRLRVPLVLEYNGSEVWVARNWDSSRFRVWLRLCEEYALAAASLIVVVSEPLRQELIERGIPREKILLNPNAVDPQVFQPGCGGVGVRRELGLAADDFVACFVGTFSYWHGIPVLQEAASRLLEMSEGGAEFRKLRFLMIGDGPLRAEMAEKLAPWVRAGKVIFTRSVPHHRVPQYLDAADIFLSPHIPFSDGSEFFGSPTKIFEYMAMGKAIIASNLGQIGLVLSHGETGWMVTPGKVDELVFAVAYLSEHPEIRSRLGKHSRDKVIAHHTWQQNARAVLKSLQELSGFEPLLAYHGQPNATNPASKVFKSNNRLGSA